MTGPGGGGKTVPLSDQEPISSDAKRGMMMKAAPASTFVVSQSQLLFEFLVVPLNDPALLGQLDQVSHRGLGGEGARARLQNASARFADCLDANVLPIQAEKGKATANCLVETG